MVNFTPAALALWRDTWGEESVMTDAIKHHYMHRSRQLAMNLRFVTSIARIGFVTLTDPGTLANNRQSGPGCYYQWSARMENTFVDPTNLQPSDTGFSATATYVRGTHDKMLEDIKQDGLKRDPTAMEEDIWEESTFLPQNFKFVLSLKAVINNRYKPFEDWISVKPSSLIPQTLGVFAEREFPEGSVIGWIDGKAYGVGQPGADWTPPYVANFFGPNYDVYKVRTLFRKVHFCFCSLISFAFLQSKVFKKCNAYYGQPLYVFANDEVTTPNNQRVAPAYMGLHFIVSSEQIGKLEVEQGRKYHYRTHQSDMNCTVLQNGAVVALKNIVFEEELVSTKSPKEPFQFTTHETRAGTWTSNGNDVGRPLGSPNNAAAQAADGSS